MRCGHRSAARRCRGSRDSTTPPAVATQMVRGQELAFRWSEHGIVSGTLVKGHQTYPLAFAEEGRESRAKSAAAHQQIRAIRGPPAGDDFEHTPAAAASAPRGHSSAAARSTPPRACSSRRRRRPPSRPTGRARSSTPISGPPAAPPGRAGEHNHAACSGEQHAAPARVEDAARRQHSARERSTFAGIRVFWQHVIIVCACV